jgi:hypothetical protein
LTNILIRARFPPLLPGWLRHFYAPREVCIHDGVIPVASLEDIQVGSGTTHQRIVAGSPGQTVRASSADQDIDSGACIHHIIGFSTDGCVVLGIRRIRLPR